MSKQVYRLGIAVALVSLGFVVTNQLLTPPPGVTEVNVKRLRPGMTLDQIEAILGQRPERQGFGVGSGGFGRPFGGFGSGGFRGGGPSRTPELPRPEQPVENKQEADIADHSRAGKVPGELGQDQLPAVRVVVTNGGQGIDLERVLAHIKDGFPYVAQGEAGTATVYLGNDGRLKRAEWQPWPWAAAPKTGLVGRLREGPGW
jgi:hypothetical protein